MKNIYLINELYRCLKGIIHPKMNILALITHPHVVPNTKDSHSMTFPVIHCYWIQIQNQ